MCITISSSKLLDGFKLKANYYRCLTAIGIVLLNPVQAVQMPQLTLHSLQVPEAIWDQASSQKVAGLPLHTRAFTSTQSPVQVARSLARHDDVFQRVLTGKHKIILSGLQPGWHWLAEINAMPTGAEGYVSALYVDADDLHPAAVHSEPKQHWIPAGAKQRFSHSALLSTGQLTQQVYSVPMSVSQVFSQAQNDLQDDGWQVDSSTAALTGHRRWTRKGGALTVFAYPQSLGSSVLIQYVQ